MRQVDFDTLVHDISTLAKSAQKKTGVVDLKHLYRVRALTRLFFVSGYGIGLFWFNPVSVLLISVATFARWTMSAHHILHGGYDKAPGTPSHLTSSRFAKGWRRWVDWPDWMHPEAWKAEHNLLHHYRLGEVYDPDQPEKNLDPLRNSSLPIWLRYCLLPVGAMLWKPLYYAPNTMLEFYKREYPKQPAPKNILDLRVWVPWHPIGRMAWLKCWLPYLVYMAVLTLPALVIPGAAWGAIVANLIAAEFLTNVHAFVVIVPNHAGEDIYRFEGKPRGRGDFYVRQIIGTANYRTGGFMRDYLHGFLNYQIEHHLWPELSMHQYRTLQPELKSICKKHALPYVQQSVWTRLSALSKVMVGVHTMPQINTRTMARRSKGSAGQNLSSVA